MHFTFSTLAVLVKWMAGCFVVFQKVEQNYTQPDFLSHNAPFRGHHTTNGIAFRLQNQESDLQ